VRIKRLTLAGFGPYKDRQVVDFERFADDGIFLITGKTGAGKSSILDAICYALYASVPRYEGTQQQLRSDHCEPDDPSFVELVFNVNDVDYRVRRSPEFDRPKKRGAGTTREAATAELAELVGDEWVGKSARAVDVGVELGEILGLSKDQFLQVILLAQNRFQKFLRSNSDERQTVLRTLFGTKRFEQFEALLTERRKALDARVAADHAALRQYSQQVAGILQQEPAPDIVGQDWFDDALATLTAELEAATAAAREADSAASAAELDHQRLADTQRRQQRRSAAVERLAALEVMGPAIESDRTTLASALRAEAVWPQLQARLQADSELERARVVEARAHELYSVLRPDLDTVDAIVLDVDIDETTRQLGALSDAAEDERRLPGLEADVTRAQTALTAQVNLLAASAELIATLPPRVEALAGELTELHIAASRLDDSEGDVARIVSARDNAGRADRLRAELVERERDERAASGAHLAAAKALDDVLDRRLNGYAAELADTLVDGEPCAVCGSLAHPSPARPSDGAVTEATVRDARSALSAAAHTLDAAHAEVLAVSTRVSEAHALAGGRTIDDLEKALVVAEASRDVARAAHTRSKSVAKDLTKLESELRAARDSSESLAAEREAAAQRLTVAVSLRDSVSERVTVQRGEFASISERVERLQHHLAAARELDRALSTTHERITAREVASTNLAAQLSSQGFADEASARAARRSPDEVARWQRTIREHEQSLATTRSILAEDELQDLPDTPVELGDAESTLALSRERRDIALASRGALSERVVQLEDVVSRARKQKDGAAALRAESEQLRELASAVQGLEPNTKRMRLETYVLAAQLEEIVAAANARLRTMTAGRFTLEHDDSLQFRKTQSGLGLRILDAHTGRSRATHSLSGGETFLASLALALGLAEVVTNQVGGITLDTLFIDEGFGSLDHDTLETAMSTLDGLRAGGRTIGLISHVDTMKEQIPAKLRIRVTDQGYSEIDESYDLG
jgi:exonuclease SbcC